MRANRNMPFSFPFRYLNVNRFFRDQPWIRLKARDVESKADSRLPLELVDLHSA